MLIQTLAGAIILFSFDKFTISLGLIALIPVAIYPFAKRFTWWPQLFLGIAFNWGALIGWSSLMGSLSLSPILLYLSGISWTLFYDTIYAHQDKEDDALIGVKSTARLFQINLDINNADNCLMIFRSNRNAGLLPVLGFTCAIILQSIILTS